MNNNSRSISFTKKIDSSAKDLWEIISKPGNLNFIHPFCKQNDIIEWNKKESKDVLVYLNGLTYFREFTEWHDQKGYSLLIGRKRGHKSKVNWEITTSNNSVYLTITVYPFLLNNWPSLFSYLPFVICIKPQMKKYLNSVTSGINWWLVNNKPVPKNHFGKHSWFSKT